MITYPIVHTTKSPSSTARVTPDASTSTPAICSKVSNRNATSSESWADANQVKFIHAHHTAKNVAANPHSAVAVCPPESSWCSAAGRPPDRDDEGQVEEQLERGRGPVLLVGSRTTARPRNRSRWKVSRCVTIAEASVTFVRATRSRLDTDGFVVIERAVGADVLNRVHAELAPYLGESALHGRNDFEGFSTNRVYALLAKAPSVAELVEHPDGRRPAGRAAAARATCCRPTWRSTCCPARRHRGCTPTTGSTGCRVLARRSGSARSGRSTTSPSENGATQVIPGSHRWGAEVPGRDRPAHRRRRHARRLGGGVPRHAVAPRRARTGRTRRGWP